METIRNLINQAEKNGHSEAELPSRREAELFRLAFKNYKRRYKVGESLTTNIYHTNKGPTTPPTWTVTIYKKVEVKIKEKVGDKEKVDDPVT